MTNNKTYKLITAPILNPVTLDELKSHLRVAHAEQDDLISNILDAATQQFQNDTEMQVMDAEFKLLLDCWPFKIPEWNAHVLIWKTPVSSINSIKYYDSSNSVQTLSAENYYTDIADFPARIRIDYQPNLSDKLNAVEISFNAGYISQDLVDKQIKDAILKLSAHYYENPQAIMTGTQVNEVPLSYRMIVRSYKKRMI